MDFSGKNVWVTGAGKGIGYATALAFVEAGAKVTGFDQAFTQEQYPFATEVMDVADAGQVAQVCQRLLAETELIWKRHLTLDELNATSDNTMVAHLGIVYTRLGDDVLEALILHLGRQNQSWEIVVLMNRGGVAALVGWVRQFWDEPDRIK